MQPPRGSQKPKIEAQKVPVRFFKNGIPWRKVLRYVVGVLAVVLAVYVTLLALLQPYVHSLNFVQVINAFSITKEMVTDNPVEHWDEKEKAAMYEHPDVNKIHGIDDNENMIRDDVEYMLFAWYREEGDAVVAAALQYAQSLQLFMAVQGELSANAAEYKYKRALLCIAEAVASRNLSTEEEIALSDEIVHNVERLQFNDKGGKRREPFMKASKLVTEKPEVEKPYCDVDFNTHTNE